MADIQTLTLIEAAFRHALDPFRFPRLLEEWSDKLALSPERRSLSGVFLPWLDGVPIPTAPGALTLIDLCRSPDDSGLDFSWAVNSSETPVTFSVLWPEIRSLPIPDEADEFIARLVAIRGAGFADLVYREFETHIATGAVGLMVRRPSPFAGPTPLPREAAPYVRVTDWDRGEIEVAGEKVFSARVLPKLDPEAAYRAKIENSKYNPRNLAKTVVEHLYPNGLPTKEQLNDKAFLDSIEAEYKRIGVRLPSDSTLKRASGRKK